MIEDLTKHLEGKKHVYFDNYFKIHEYPAREGNLCLCLGTV
jgi:hypothetical protein